MADDDKELFDSAMDVTPEAPQPEPQPQADPVQEDGQPRDEHGRFAPKVADPVEEPKAISEPPPVIEQPEPQPQGIPSWRLKEEADARRAAEERANHAAQQLAEMQRMMAQLQQQTKQPEQVPDIFDNPSGFVGHEVRNAVDPIRSEILNLREFYSRREAERQHGEDKVQAAYDALLSARQKNDPEAVAVIQRIVNSMDPYGDIVGWHQKQVVFSQIGSDPNAWFEKQLEERAKDPAFQKQLLERIRGQVQQPQRPVTQLPPSLNKATSSGHHEDADDDTEAGLLKSALRR